MKLYLSIIRGEVQVRPYKTRCVVYKFDSADILAYAGVKKFYLQINLIIASVSWLINEKGLVYFDNTDKLRLTDKGLDMYWNKRRREA